MHVQITHIDSRVEMLHVSDLGIDIEFLEHESSWSTVLGFQMKKQGIM